MPNKTITKKKTYQMYMSESQEAKSYFFRCKALARVLVKMKILIMNYLKNE